MTQKELNELREEFREIQKEGMKLLGTTNVKDFHRHCKYFTKEVTGWKMPNYITPLQWIKMAHLAVNDLSVTYGVNEYDYLVRNYEDYPF